VSSVCLRGTPHKSRLQMYIGWSLSDGELAGESVSETWDIAVCARVTLSLDFSDFIVERVNIFV
jgi:hypothetical protein